VDEGAQTGTLLHSLLESGPQRKNMQQKEKSFSQKCKAAHHRSICNDARTATKHTTETTLSTVRKIDVTSPKFNYLKKARIWVMETTGLTKLTRGDLDGGIQSSFIANSLTI
jgi:hypothetical protein